MNAPDPFAVRATVRRAKCMAAGCTHDLSICDDPQGACPNGLWDSGLKMGGGMRTENPLPSMMAMAGNLLIATGKDILAGMPRRDMDEMRRITAICDGGGGARCQHFRPSDRKCSLCGCPVVEKIAMEREHCPIGKW